MYSINSSNKLLLKHHLYIQPLESCVMFFENNRIKHTDNTNTTYKQVL